MSKSTLHNPHDKLFRAAMQYPEVAHEFLEMHLPEYIKKNLDFSSITTCPNTFVDEDLKLLHSDVLLKALVSGSKTYFYILAEHQSKPDPLMPFRLIQHVGVASCLVLLFFILLSIPNNNHLKAPALTSLNVKRNLLT